MTGPVPSPRHAALRAVLRVPVAALAVGLFSAAMWWVWLGWDTTYYDVDGVAQGPYRPWQVVGCGAAIVVACVLARRWAPHWLGLVLVAPAAVVGFAVPWSADASSDETGMWVVGLFLLLVGGWLGLMVVLSITEVVLRTRAQERAATS